MFKLPNFLDSSRSYAPFILSLFASAGIGVIAGYFIFKRHEMTTEEIASELAKRAKKDPSALEPVTSVYQYMINGWRPVYFPGPKGGAPGFFATPFKPSLNGGVAHVIYKKGHEKFYLINIQSRVLDDGKREDVADLPAGFSNSGEPSELARTQNLITLIGQDRRKHPQMNYEQYQASMLQHAKAFDPRSTVPIDETLEEGVRRECLEETGLCLDKPGVIFNIINFNRGSQLVAHVLYEFECEDLPPLNPQAEEGISRSAWVNVDDIHVEKSSEGKCTGTVLINGKAYRIKPYDLIAEHVYKVMSELGCVDDSNFLPRVFYHRAQYESKTIGGTTTRPSLK